MTAFHILGKRPTPAVADQEIEKKGDHVSVVVAEPQSARTLAETPTTLAVALREVELKRTSDLIRFRTCCADPRASK